MSTKPCKVNFNARGKTWRTHLDFAEDMTFARLFPDLGGSSSQRWGQKLSRPAENVKREYGRDFQYLSYSTNMTPFFSVASYVPHTFRPAITSSIIQPLTLLR